MKLLTRGNKIWCQNKARNYKDDWASETETSDFLYGLVRLLKPEKCLEIGTFEGDATIAIGRALKDNNLGYLLTADIKDFGQVKNILESGLSGWVHCYINNPPFTEDFLEKAKCDFIFIDDGHEYNEVTRDLEIAHKVCIKGGYILGHDVIGIKTVKKAYEDFLIRYQNQYKNLILFSYAGLFILHKI